MHGREWTAEEDTMLSRLYPHEDTKLVAEKLNRSIYSVKDRARNLKIRKTKEAYDRSRREAYKKEGKEINKLPMGDVPLEKAYMNEEWLRYHYISLELSAKDIADKVGVEKTAILRWMNDYGIAARKEEISENTRTKMSIAASAKRGEKTSRWNGGVSESGHNGYRYILKPDHPKVKENGYVAEHRLVMETVLGRLLTDEEIVHHRDENKKNNDPSNLFLFPDRSSHAKFHQYKRYKNPDITEEEFTELLSRKHAI